MPTIDEVLVRYRADDRDAEAADKRHSARMDRAVQGNERLKTSTKQLEQQTELYAESAARLERQLLQVANKSQQAATLYDVTNGSLRSLNQEQAAHLVTLAGEIDKAEKAAAAQQKLNSIYKQMPQAMQRAGAALTVGLTLPIIAVGKAAFETAVRFDSYERGLTAIMGSSQAAKAEMEKLTAVAKLPGLGLEDAFKGSINLQAAGLSADRARSALMAFGNALATVGKGKADLDGVNLALTQIETKTKLNAQDIRQLQERVPQIRVAMQAAFNTADVDKITQMGITGAKFIDAIVAQLAKLPKVTGGLRNDVENLSDAWAKFLNEGAKSITPMAQDLLPRLTGALEHVSEAFSHLSPQSKTFAADLLVFGAAIGPVTMLGGSFAGTAVKVLQFRKELLLARGAATAVAEVGVAAEGAAAGVGLLGLAVEALPLIGVVATLAAVTYGIMKLAEASGDLQDRYDAINKETFPRFTAGQEAIIKKHGENAGAARTLLAEYQKLEKDGYGKTEQGAKRLQKVLNDLSTLNPTLVTGFDSQGNAIGLVADAVDRLNKSLKDYKGLVEGKKLLSYLETKGTMGQEGGQLQERLEALQRANDLLASGKLPSFDPSKAKDSVVYDPRGRMSVVPQQPPDGAYTTPDGKVHIPGFGDLSQAGDIGKAIRDLKKAIADKTAEMQGLQINPQQGSGKAQPSIEDERFANALKKAKEDLAAGKDPRRAGAADYFGYTLPEFKGLAGDKQQKLMREWDAIEATHQKAAKVTETAWKNILKLGEQFGFTTGKTSSPNGATFGGHHLSEAHPDGRAVDFSMRGHTQAEIDAFISEMRSRGFKVIKETSKESGGKYYSAPNIHVEAPKGKKISESGTLVDEFGPTPTQQTLQTIAQLRGEVDLLRNSKKTLAQITSQDTIAEKAHEMALAGVSRAAIEQWKALAYQKQALMDKRKEEERERGVIAGMQAEYLKITHTRIEDRLALEQFHKVYSKLTPEHQKYIDTLVEEKAKIDAAAEAEEHRKEKVQDSLAAFERRIELGKRANDVLSGEMQSMDSVFGATGSELQKVRDQFEGIWIEAINSGHLAEIAGGLKEIQDRAEAVAKAIDKKRFQDMLDAPFKAAKYETPEEKRSGDIGTRVADLMGSGMSMDDALFEAQLEAAYEKGQKLKKLLHDLNEEKLKLVMTPAEYRKHQLIDIERLDPSGAGKVMDSEAENRYNAILKEQKDTVRELTMNWKQLRRAQLEDQGLSPEQIDKVIAGDEQLKRLKELKDIADQTKSAWEEVFLDIGLHGKNAFDSIGKAALKMRDVILTKVLTALADKSFDSIFGRIFNKGQQQGDPWGGGGGSTPGGGGGWFGAAASFAASLKTGSFGPGVGKPMQLPAGTFYPGGGMGGGSGIQGALAAGLMNFFQRRANGGPLLGGQYSIVGERGPELIRADRNTVVIPNHELQGAQGGSGRIGGSGRKMELHMHFHANDRKTAEYQKENAGAMSAKVMRQAMEHIRRSTA